MWLEPNRADGIVSAKLATPHNIPRRRQEMTAVEDRSKNYATRSEPHKPATPPKESATTLESLRSEINSLRDTVGNFVSSNAGAAAQTVKETTSEVATQIGNTASGLASAASDQAKTLTAELERVGRANPLGAIAGALLVGVLIGMIGRGRG
jgi:ElaB/YqjD/DUF883 family membrane-anchored ribosome-binding protein